MLRRMKFTARRFALFPILPVFGLILAVSPTLVRAETSPLKEARTALDALSAKNRAAASVTLAFTSRVMGADGDWMPSGSGSLVTADSGRFRLKHSQGTVISDGRTMWQYFPSTKQVVIRPAVSAGQSGGNSGGAGGVLLRFFQAKAVAAERVSGALRIVLDPASVGENLDSLIVTLSPDAGSVRRVETLDPAGNRAEYTVSTQRYDGRPGRAAFKFQVPAGADVVDMR